MEDELNDLDGMPPRADHQDFLNRAAEYVRLAENELHHVGTAWVNDPPSEDAFDDAEALRPYIVQLNSMRGELLRLAAKWAALNGAQEPPF